MLTYTKTFTKPYSQFFVPLSSHEELSSQFEEYIPPISALGVRSREFHVLIAQWLLSLRLYRHYHYLFYFLKERNTASSGKYIKKAAAVKNQKSTIRTEFTSQTFHKTSKKAFLFLYKFRPFTNLVTCAPHGLLAGRVHNGHWPASIALDLVVQFKL